MTPRVVVLGSSGFVGTALLSALREHDNFVVEGYHSSDFNLAAPDCVARLSDVTDENTILIVATRSRGWQDQFQAVSDEVAMVSNVARCLLKTRVKKCLYFSSLSVYGDAATNLSITEQTAIAPTSPYGIAKFAGERLISQAAREVGIPMVVLRPCKVYGPGDNSSSYGPMAFIEGALREGRIKIYGDGSELRDHVFIHDLVQITVKFAFNTQSGVYNVGTGQSHTFQEIADCLQKRTQQAIGLIHAGRDRPKIDQRIDVAKLRSALPEAGFTGIEQGLVETYHHLYNSRLQAQ